MRTKLRNHAAFTSAATGVLLSLLCGLSFYAYRTCYVANLLEFYSSSAIGARVTLLEYALSAIGLLIGAQLLAATWWAGCLVLLANSLLLPWVVVVLSEDMFLAPGYGILFFLPLWLSLRLFFCQAFGLLAMAVIKRHGNLTFTGRINF